MYTFLEYRVDYPKDKEYDNSNNPKFLSKIYFALPSLSESIYNIKAKCFFTTKFLSNKTGSTIVGTTTAKGEPMVGCQISSTMRRNYSQVNSYVATSYAIPAFSCASCCGATIGVSSNSGLDQGEQLSSINPSGQSKLGQYHHSIHKLTYWSHVQHIHGIQTTRNQMNLQLSDVNATLSSAEGSTDHQCSLPSTVPSTETQAWH